MPSFSDPRPVRSRPTREETRARLLDAAGRVFARHGYERASLADVAAAAGLTKGAVYSSFSSKDDLFLELMKERIGERVALVGEAAQRTDNVDDLTIDIGGGLRDLLATQRDWQLLYIEFWSQAVRNPDLQREFAKQRRRARALIGDEIQRMADETGKQLAVHAQDLAACVLGVANGMALEQIADPETIDPDLLPLTLQMLIRGAIASADSFDGRQPDRV